MVKVYSHLKLVVGLNTVVYYLLCRIVFVAHKLIHVFNNTKFPTRVMQQFMIDNFYCTYFCKHQGFPTLSCYVSY